MGMAYFKLLVDTMDGVPYALASYNAGERRVSQWKAARPGVPEDEFIDDIPFPETQNYVKRIMGTADDYRRLYGDGLLTPIGSRNLVLASTGAGVPARTLPSAARKIGRAHV